MIPDVLRPWLAGAAALTAAVWTWRLFDAVTEARAAEVKAVEVTARPLHPRGHVLRLDGASALVVHGLEIPREGFTAECWALAEPGRRTSSVLGTTADGGFEILWQDPGDSPALLSPTAYLRASRVVGSRRSGWIVGVSAETPEARRWTHVALTYDTRRVRLFLDGRIVSDVAVLGEYVASAVPLVIGGDAEEDGSPTDLFEGAVDDVRISRGVRYTAPFRPTTDPEPDAATLLLLTFEDPSQPFFSPGTPPRTAVAVGTPRVE